MFARLRRAVLFTSAAALSAKAVIITASGDWDDVYYAAKKRLQPSLSRARKPRVVVLGSGWGALSFIQKLDQDAVDLTVVSPRSFFFYTPLLAGTATGTVSAASIMEPVRWCFPRSGHSRASFVQAECTKIDPAAKSLTLQAPHLSPQTLDYDYLVVAVGAVPNTFNISGVRENTTFLKEVEDGMAIQRTLLHNLERASALLAAAGPSPSVEVEAEAARLLSWVVIGGGPTGVELSAELTDFLRQEVRRYFPQLAPRVTITLLEATDRVLGTFDRALSAAAAATLTSLGARVLCGAAVTRVTPSAVEFRRTAGGEAGAVPHGGVCVWAGGVARRPVVEAFAKAMDPAGALQTSRHGLVVDPYFRVKGVADGSVFALGDCAVSGCAPTAQAAVQQGRYLGRAFRDALPALAQEAPPLAPFTFRSRGALAYTGGGTGVAELASLKRALWDAHPQKGGARGGEGATTLEGAPAFAVWRGLYFSSILSTSNQFRVAFDWFRTIAFGREISAPGGPGPAR